MMKHIKRFVLLTLCVVGLCAVLGCNDNTNDTDNGGGNTEAPSFSTQPSYGNGTVSFVVDKAAAQLFWVLYNSDDNPANPTIASIKADANGSGGARRGNTGTAIADATTTITITDAQNLADGTYYFYLVVEDAKEQATLANQVKIVIGDNSTNPGTLTLEEVGTNGNFTFTWFDGAHGETETTEINFNDSDVKMYDGTFNIDGIKVPVFLAIDPNATIDRLLVVVNGGTGSDGRNFVKADYNHKAQLMVSMRGLDIGEVTDEECTLGGGLVSCLKAHPYLSKYSARDNGVDIIKVINHLLTDQASSAYTITDASDVTTQPTKSLLGITDYTVNFTTGSYGATLLAYGLEYHNSLTEGAPSLGRIFIDGPSSPSEDVITDGFRNGKEQIDNLLEALNFTATEKNDFLAVLRARHTAPNTNCDASNPAAATVDCLASGMIISYAILQFEGEIGLDSLMRKWTDTSKIATDLAALKAQLLAIPSTEATGSVFTDTVKPIYVAVDDSNRFQTSWESAIFDLTGTTLGFTSPGFTSRIGQICSAYVNRVDGDSQSKYNAAKADTANDPYWYGFLHSYRQILGVCDSASNNTANGITVPPASLAVNAEAIVQYGAGLDEKHHQVDIDEIEALFGATTIKKQVIRRDQTQGGVGPLDSECRRGLEEKAFEGTLSSLASELDTIISSNACTTGEYTLN